MARKPWESKHIQLCESQIGHLISDAQTLEHYSKDFGRLVQALPKGVFIPDSVQVLQRFLAFASQHALPVTLRANGFSQSGQTLVTQGGVSVHLKAFNRTEELSENKIWIEANSTWSALVDNTLCQGKIPYITPYNLNLSIGGLLSVGGVGAASFKQGMAVSHVDALTVITASGELRTIDETDPLFHACLGGQGQYAVITKARVKLRTCQPKVKTFVLLYDDPSKWHHDLQFLQHSADFIESFCSPMIGNSQICHGERRPLLTWFYWIYVSYEYDEKSPLLSTALQPWKIVSEQDETMYAYLHRHDNRFAIMKRFGQWDLWHPWFECLVSEEVLSSQLQNILQILPPYYANLLHIVPIAYRQPMGSVISPQGRAFYSMMILNPGIAHDYLTDCVKVIHDLDEKLLTLQGKRYLSGFLGYDVNIEYWKTHFGPYFSQWVEYKKQYDPVGIFSSLLHTCDYGY